MRFFSTRHPDISVDSATAILGSLASDGGLYFPEALPQVSGEALKIKMPIADIGLHFLSPFFADAFSPEEFEAAITSALTFEAPLKELEKNLYVLELFHGPTLAFKDFGARVMAEFMSCLAAKQNRTVTVLTATSGDTGGAVAQAFHKKPGVRVVVLFPKGRISLLQEKQMTTLGENIRAVAVDGTFDDCQALAKQAFIDAELAAKCGLVSANSINISRLLPQTLYYLSALQQLDDPERAAFAVPCGNSGNIFAGMLLRFMGRPALQFVAATNENKTFADYLRTGTYTPRPSVTTLSNAMDVGAPSNLERVRYLFRDSMSALRSCCWAATISESETVAALQHLSRNLHYTACPHTAVGIDAALRFRTEKKWDAPLICLATAHPGKFGASIASAAGIDVSVPKSLSMLLNAPAHSTQISNSFSDLRILLEQAAA